MSRKLSTIAPDWWDYTTLEDDLIRDSAKLTPRQIEELARPGFRVVMYDTLEDFYLAEALEYIDTWRASTLDNPVGICGPIGPTEHVSECIPVSEITVNESTPRVSECLSQVLDRATGQVVENDDLRDILAQKEIDRV